MLNVDNNRWVIKCWFIAYYLMICLKYVHVLNICIRHLFLNVAEEKCS